MPKTINIQLKDADYLLFDTMQTEFCNELAKITAVIMSRFPPELSDEIRVRLQDCTSLYSPYTWDLTEEITERIRKEMQDATGSMS